MGTFTESMKASDILEHPQELSLALAFAILVDRVKGLPKEDRQDLYELMLELPKAESSGDVSEVLDAMLEILDQEPVRTVTIEQTKLDPQAGPGLKKWIDVVSERIRHSRIEAKLTQQELADRADIPQSHISRLENGKHSPSFATLEKIAAALNRPVSDLAPSAD